MPSSDAEISTRNRILQAAMSLVSSSGLTGLSMTAVADAAGISRQTLYNHFADMDAILEAATMAHSQDSLESMRLMISTLDTAQEKLEYVLRRHIVGAIEHGQVTESMSARALIAQGEVHHHMQLAELITEILQEGIAAGEFQHDTQPEYDVAYILGVMNASAQQAAHDPAQLGKVVAASRLFLRRALKAQP